MSSSFKILLNYEKEQTSPPLSMSANGLRAWKAVPVKVLGNQLLWRIPGTGEWYKPNGYGRYSMIDRKLHNDLDNVIRNRGIKSAYDTPIQLGRLIKVDFIVEITK